MSGIEPGRPKIEWRDTGYIWTGTRVLNEHGQEFVVLEAGRYSLLVLNQHGLTEVLYAPKFRCRVEEEDR